MSNNISTKPLSGFMELLPNEQQLFNQMMDTVKTVYEQNGFIPMDQPVMDRKEVLLAKAGGETEQQIYELTKGDTQLALRFDLTVPLARYVANNYGSLTFPFRRYAIGKVYRGERAQAGRFREFYQCDIDIIGNETLAIGYDAQMPLVMAQIFEHFDSQLGTGHFKIRINNRKLYDGLFQSLKIQDNREEIMQLIDKKEKISDEDFNDQLQSIGLVRHVHTTLEQFLSCTCPEELDKLPIDNETFTTGVSEINEVFTILHASPYDPTYFVFDPTIARGLDYYTGTVFETQLISYPDIGSVCSGGRYDNLAGAYTSRSLPGVGTSIGLSRLFDQLLKKEVINAPSTQTSSRVVIIPLDNQYTACLQLERSLQMNSIPCETSWSTSKLDKRLGYGDKMGIPYAVLVGENEAAENMYTLRDMHSGNEELLTLEQVIEKLQ